MNKEDIIRMARESGLTQFTGNYDQSWALERFFHMAYAAGAAAERNKLAKWMIQRSYATGHGDTIEDLLKELEWQIKERIDAWEHSLAETIRARGKV